MKAIPILTESDLKRFWSKVDKCDSDDCWEWTANKADGYGQFSVGFVSYGAHRVSYFIKNKDPGNMCVCHTCDNRSCVNPEHLWLGTVLDNNRDMQDKGRQIRGEQTISSILTETQVVEILESDETNSALADVYGVVDSTISNIRRGKKWKHLKGKRHTGSGNIDGQTGVRGVSPYKGRFQARITSKGKHYWLGAFDTIVQAKQALGNWKKEHLTWTT